MSPFTLLKYYMRCFTSPAKIITPALTLRTLLRQPVLFDLCSVTLQALNLKYISNVHENKVTTSQRHVDAQKHNADVTASKRITTTRRQEEYYKIVSMPSRDVRNEKLLIVGPRNLSELFMAWTYGFEWSNIQGIDLYSTHPKIQEMNMEHMTFEDESFNAVTMCMTLGYANDTKLALSEVVRILKNNGRFSFSVTYDPNTKEWPEETIYNGRKIVETLHELGMNVYHHSSFEKVNKLGSLVTLHSIGAVKEDSTEKRHDHLLL